MDKQWEEQKWQKRDEEYEAMKMDIQNLMLEKLYSILPLVKKHITQCELSTPLSTKHFSSYAAGEIYGLEHTPKRFRLRQLRAKLKSKTIPNRSRYSLRGSRFCHVFWNNYFCSNT
ncbi:MAG: hypothetical protein IPH89_07055 [Bacteroidetes bacterium]|nr:hypothetical protein [Bacteroidota bacterium]